MESHMLVLPACSFWGKMRGRVTKYQVEKLFLEQQAVASRKQTAFKTEINCETPLPWRAIRICSHVGDRDAIPVRRLDFRCLGSQQILICQQGGSRTCICACMWRCIWDLTVRAQYVLEVHVMSERLHLPATPISPTTSHTSCSCTRTQATK